MPRGRDILLRYEQNGEPILYFGGTNTSLHIHLIIYKNNEFSPRSAHIDKVIMRGNTCTNF